MLFSGGALGRDWHKADMPTAAFDVRFRGQSGHALGSIPGSEPELGSEQRLSRALGWVVGQNQLLDARIPH